MLFPFLDDCAANEPFFVEERFAVHSSLNVFVDNGIQREEYVLDSPTKGFHLPSGCRGIQYKHSPDSVLLVLASHEYDAKDYIRNYNEFLKYKGIK